MGEIGIDKLLLIMVVILLLFGAKRIPEIGQSLGKGLREFKRSMSDVNRELSRTDAPPRYRPPAPSVIDPPSRDVPVSESKTPPAEPRRLM